MIGMVKKHWTVFVVGIVTFKIRLLMRARRLPKVLEHLTPCAIGERGDMAKVDDFAYYVDRWLQLFPYHAKGNCFPRSLALYYFARRSGIPVDFHCGVRKTSAGMEGHAWLTLNDEPFQEANSDLKHFTVTFSYPSPPREPSK